MMTMTLQWKEAKIRVSSSFQHVFIYSLYSVNHYTWCLFQAPMLNIQGYSNEARQSDRSVIASNIHNSQACWKFADFFKQGLKFRQECRFEGEASDFSTRQVNSQPDMKQCCVLQFNIFILIYKIMLTCCLWVW